MVVLLSISTLCLGLYLAYVGRNAYFFKRIPSPGAPSHYPFISVIIPARNEGEHLMHCLKAVLNQSYPESSYEVILVDDHSTDQSPEMAHNLALREKRLQVILNQGRGKKAALETGIDQAIGEWIVQTDADCLCGPDWLQTMAACFKKQTALVSGPILLESGPHALERLQALESMGLVAYGAGAMAAGKPNMCNGANMAYRKKTFEEVGGYENIDQVASGDDELLLQKIDALGTWDMQFAKSPKAIVRTRPQASWSAFKSQRIRWVSKVRAYQNRRTNLVQFISYLGFLAFPLWIIWAVYHPVGWSVFIGLFLLKCLIDYWLMQQAAAFFHKLPLMSWFFLLELVYTPYVLWVGLAGSLVREYEWKGRKIK